MSADACSGVAAAGRSDNGNFPFPNFGLSENFRSKMQKKLKTFILGVI